MEEKKSSFKIRSILAVFIIFQLVRALCFTNYVVDGQSMEPYLGEGNKLIVDRVVYQFSSVKRFDVIVFHANRKEDYVKRVIGIPGDVIVYQDDKLVINEKEYSEPYLVDHPFLGQQLTGDFTLKELTGVKRIPEGNVFVLGDNRLESLDSRHIGLIPMDRIVGKVDLKYWPLSGSF
ncbi:signal peptidase I [Peribacillus sp. FSL H8-0477]|uniref:signal peptidase I n=1 Tax=Peribacillus sp. FSL H8-0477 TaxID=2921388 RepID=UPI0030FCED5B